MSQERLVARLGHTFSDPGLLRQALTHRSAGNPHNERLEFLGDAILSCVVAEALFRRFPQAREGQLTRVRASLVKGATLAQMARELELGADLKLGGGELKSGGRDRGSILADALEAIIGAVYLDGGQSACSHVIEGLYRERLDAISLDGIPKDPKTRLQEWLQSRRLPLPAYRVLSVEGEDHSQVFTVQCELEVGQRAIRGQGASRRKAEQAAAKSALSVLESNAG